MKKLFIAEENIPIQKRYNNKVFYKEDIIESRDNAISFWNEKLEPFDCKLVLIKNCKKAKLTIKYDCTPAGSCGMHIPSDKRKRDSIYIDVERCLECAEKNNADEKKVVPNVFKHELGHFLGLKDSKKPELLMFEFTSKGENDTVAREELEQIYKKYHPLINKFGEMADQIGNKRRK